jgi:hypothetical protein
MGNRNGQDASHLFNDCVFHNLFYLAPRSVISLLRISIAVNTRHADCAWLFCLGFLFSP